MTSIISLIFMMLMIFVSNADDPTLSLHRRHVDDLTNDGENIQTCQFMYVEPGQDFNIRCESEHAVLIRVSFCR